MDTLLNNKHRVLFIIILVIITVTLILQFNMQLVKGNANMPTKRYHSIIINKNDTLWDIANTYMNKDYYSITKYIEEVKQINNLYCDKIKAGDSLIIPYIAPHQEL